MQLLVATQNPGKLAEITAILSDLGVEILNPSQVGLTDFDVEETGATLAENAYLKAKAFAEVSQLVSLSDDSGLEVAALDGQPGVYSKRYVAGSDEDRYRHLLKVLEGQTNRQAAFKTVLCLYDPITQQAEYFEGVLPGHITTAPKGEYGFGYDPVFLPTGETKTLAELAMNLKNQVSHRARALQKLQAYLAKKD